MRSEAGARPAAASAERLEDVEKFVRNHSALLAEILECLDYLLIRDLEQHGPDGRMDGPVDAV